MIKQVNKIFKLFILWLSSENKWVNPYKLIKKNSLSDRETILYLKQNPRAGIIRYGNSELGLMVGNSPKTQKYDRKLSDRLIKNCQNYNSTTKKKYLLSLPIESLVVGHNNTKRRIPNWYPGVASRWAMRFLTKKSQMYGSPFCFRIYNVDDNDMEDYLRLIKSLFIRRKIIYVGPMQGKNPDIPEFMTPLEILKLSLIHI